VPHGKAVLATAENIARFEERRAELEAAAAERLGGAEARQYALNGVEIEITANASDEGKLYGSIGPREIADAVTAVGHPLNKSEVIQGEGPIRNTGEYEVLIQLHADVEATIKLNVLPE
jgi:large subunit ribosomal protein L9